MQLSVTKIILVIMVGIFCGCTIQNVSKNIKIEERLKERIDGVYLAWKERDFDKLLNYGPIDKIKNEDRKERIDEIQKVYPTLVDYHVKGIEVTDHEARVKVLVTVTIDGVKHVVESYDYWVFKENEWYLLDFGKMR